MKHVGRPTNEEVNRRKMVKFLKIGGPIIGVVALILVLMNAKNIYLKFLIIMKVVQ